MFEWDYCADYEAPVFQSPLYDGDISPHSVVESAPRQFIPPWWPAPSFRSRKNTTSYNCPISGLSGDGGLGQGAGV
jgi:hypothetical protein